jgi:hypothetical protein
MLLVSEADDGLYESSSLKAAMQIRSIFRQGSIYWKIRPPPSAPGEEGGYRITFEGQISKRELEKEEKIMTEKEKLKGQGKKKGKK